MEPLVIPTEELDHKDRETRNVRAWRVEQLGASGFRTCWPTRLPTASTGTRWRAWSTVAARCISRSRSCSNGRLAPGNSPA